MTDLQWEKFCNFKKSFYEKVQEWQNAVSELSELQKKAADLAKTPEYPVETPVVYNRDLDKITKEDEIKLIVIGDNPGKNEQLAVNNRYLVGQAGKIADGFFKRNGELEIDFRKNVIILNKTPIHSAKTAQLRYIAKEGGKKVTDLLNQTQLWMAQETAELHCNLIKYNDNQGSEYPQLWLVGYSELKSKGLFEIYRNELKRFYIENSMEYWSKVMVYQHFSMNCFTTDLTKFSKELIETGSKKNLKEELRLLGTKHKTEIFNC